MRTNWWLALVLLAGLAAPAYGQPPASRAEWLRQRRAEKSKQLEPYKANGIERAIVKIEDEYLPRLFTLRTGFYPRLGPFRSGGGFAIGPGYRLHDIFGGRGDLLTSAAVSYKRYWIVESQLMLPRLANGKAFANAHVRYTSFPEEDFFGVGPESSRPDRVTYAITQTSAAFEAGLRPSESFRFGGSTEFLNPKLGAGKDTRFPDVTDLYTETSAPGLLHQPPFVRVGGFATIDYAHPPSARQGGRYVVGLHRYIDTDGGAYTHNRLDFDLQQYLSAFNERRVLALRVMGSFSDPAEGSTVPFYMMRSLGGDHTLRGFRAFRFHDRALMLLQAEYRFEILTAMDGAIFYDTGQVAPSRSALALRDFERDYGFGVRIGTNLGVIVRLDVAFGSSEGTKTWLRFSHVF